MGFFKKTVDSAAAEAAFKELYESMLSDSEAQYHKQMLQELKNKFLILNNVQQKTFNRQLTGANLAILNFAWNKFQISKQVDIVKEFMNFGRKKSALWDKVPGLKSFSEVKEIYTDSIMRTPPGDAFTEIAQDFFMNLILNYRQLDVADVTPVVELFRQEFQKVYLVYIENFKLLNLVH